MLKKVYLFLILGSLCLLGFGQDNTLINTKQRLLMKTPDEMQEDVDSFRVLHLMIGGNVYQTEELIADAYDKKNSKYDFKDEFKYVQPLLNLGDVSIANLKTSFGNDANNVFSAPDEFGLALKYSGINAVMQANLFTGNVNKATLKRTQSLLNDFDIYHTGAFTDQIERNGNYPLIINKKGFTIAVLNYTNLPTRPEASREFFINEIDKSYIDRDMHLAYAYKPDFIVVYFNWSEEAQEAPTPAMQELTQYVFDKGANLVVGTCPNKPMRMDFMSYYYRGRQREGLVAFSLGNLIASNTEIKNRNGYIIDLEIRKNNFTGKTKIDDWGVIPVYTYFDTISEPGRTHVYSVPCWAVESGDIMYDIPYIEKRRAVNGAYEVRKLLGSTSDEIQYNMNELIVNNVGESIHLTSASLNNKFSQAHERDIKPSAPPVALGRKDTATSSLAIVASQTKPKMEFVKGVDKNAQASYLKGKPASSNVDSSSTAADSLASNAVAFKPVENNEGSNSNADNGSASEGKSGKNGRNSKGGKGGADSDNSKSSAGARNRKAGDVSSASGNSRNTATTGEKRKAGETTPINSSAGDISAGSKNDLHADLTSAGDGSLKIKMDTIYRIQFYELQKYIPLDTVYYTHLKGYMVIEESGMFKYLLGQFKSYSECYQYWKSQILPRYKQSFIIKFVGGKPVHR